MPFTPNLFSPFSHDSSLAFTLPFDQVPQFLKAVQEIPDTSSDEDDGEQKKWIMRAARGPAYGSGGAIKLWLADAWGSFVDLIKVNVFALRYATIFADVLSTRKLLILSS